MIWRICGAYEADPELRRDLQQEVLLAVWRALPRFRGEADMRTFVARIAQYRAISHVSREAKRPKKAELADDAPSSGPDPEEAAERTLQSARLAEALRELPMDQRQTLSLTLEGFSPKEIAAILGVSANVVSIRLTRGKHALRKRLGHET